MVLGVIHSIYDDFVHQVHGPHVQQTVLSAAGLSNAHGECPWSSPSQAMCPHADVWIHRLMAATSEATGFDVATVGRQFGVHFVRSIGNTGYHTLLSSFASSFPNLVSRLNNLHMHLSLGVPAFVPPDFRVEKVTANSLELHYRSKRPGLGPWVEGIMQGVSEVFFEGMPINMELIRGRDDGSDDHEVWKVMYPDHSHVIEEHAKLESDATNAIYTMDAPTFYRLHPFHLVLNEKCQMIQVGSVIGRILPSAFIGANLDSVFKIRMPYVNMDFTSLSAATNLTFVVQAVETGMELKGQFLKTMVLGRPALVFIGSPRILTLEEMSNYGVFLEDISLHDVSSDFIVIAQQKAVDEVAKGVLEKEKVAMQAETELLVKQNERTEQAYMRLEEALEEALAVRDEESGNSQLLLSKAHASVLNFKSPAEKVLELLDQLMRGIQVPMKQIHSLRDTILQAGQDLLAPSGLREQMAEGFKRQGFEQDSDVAQNLANMLVGMHVGSNRRRGSVDSIDESLVSRSEVDSMLGIHADVAESDDDPASLFKGSTNFSPVCSQVGDKPAQSSPPGDGGDTHTPKSAREPPRRSATETQFASSSLSMVQRPANSTVPGPVTDPANQPFPTSAGSLVPRPSLTALPAVTTTPSYTAQAQRPGPQGSGQQVVPSWKSFSSQLPAQPTVKPRRRVSVLLLATPAEGMPALLREPSDAVTCILAQVDNWHFNTFELAEATNNRPLSTLAFFLFKQADLISAFKLSEVRLAKFLTRIEEGYRNNPYHNRTHAADVLRTLHCIMTRGGVIAGLGLTFKMELMSAYLAAIVHDFEHKGVSNDFLIKSSDVLAVRYNDRSPMENHHVAATWELMTESAACSFMAHTGHKIRKSVRKLVIEMVLATDMTLHFSHNSLFNTKIPALLDSRNKSTGTPSGDPTHRPQLSINADELRTLVLQLVLKCADLGHLAHQEQVHMTWVLALEEEMFRQGDREKAMNMSVSPLMDRTKTGITKSQPGFYSMVVIPQLQGFCKVFPDTKPMLKQAASNYQMWLEVTAANGDRDASGSAKPCSASGISPGPSPSLDLALALALALWLPP